MESLTTYLKHPEQMDAAAIERLWKLVETYPYYQPARLLLMRSLYVAQDGRFGPALRQASLVVPDRARLFELTEGEKFALQADASTPPAVEQALPADPAGEEGSGDRTRDLINSFLASQKDEDPRSRRPARPVEASVDYLSYLMQVEEAEQALEEQQAKTASPSTDEQKERTPETPQPASDLPAEEEPTGEVTGEGATSPFLTETLARIYIKQGKYVKAIEIIRRLSLLNPKKNRYFADQIRFLEKLAVNQRNLEAEQE